MNARISPSIIMRLRDFGESDLMVGFFTTDKGRLTGLAKGARRSRKRFANCLDLFCLVSLEYEKKRGDLCFLHSCKLVEPFSGVRSDFSSLSLASYFVELTELLFPPGISGEGMFNLLKQALSGLDQGMGKEGLRVLFETKALSLGGYAIDLEKCGRCGRPYTGRGRAVFRPAQGGIACLRCEKESSVSPGLGPDSVKALRKIQSAPCNERWNIEVTGPMVYEIRAVLDLHMEYRLGRRLKTTGYL